jgi:tetratricopeptide (TPR) repeat protein
MTPSLPRLFFSLCLTAALVQAEPEPSPGPSFADLILQGYEKEQAKQYDEAMRLYTLAIRAKEDSPTVFVRRAYCAAQLGKVEQLVEDLREADRLKPVTVTDYSTMAWLKATAPYRVVRDGVLAVAYAQKLNTENPSAETHDYLAAAYAEMGNFQKAQDELRVAIKKFPDSPRLPAIKERLELYKQKKPYRDQWLSTEEDPKADKQLEKKLQK